MPLENSIFRIIHRTKNDPHGVEGYFIHELYVNPDYTLRGWRAGVTIGALNFMVLKDHMIRVIDAFRYEPIEHRDLKTGMAISRVLFNNDLLMVDSKKLEEKPWNQSGGRMTTLQVFKEGADQPFYIVYRTYAPLVGEIANLPGCRIKVLEVERGREITRVVVEVLEEWGESLDDRVSGTLSEHTPWLPGLSLE